MEKMCRKIKNKGQKVKKFNLRSEKMDRMSGLVIKLAIVVAFILSNYKLKGQQCIILTSPLPEVATECEKAQSVLDSKECDCSKVKIKDICTEKATTIACAGSTYTFANCKLEDEQCKSIPSSEQNQCKLRQPIYKIITNEKGQSQVTPRQCSVCDFRYTKGCESKDSKTPCPSRREQERDEDGVKTIDTVYCCLDERKVEFCTKCSYDVPYEKQLHCSCGHLEHKIFGAKYPPYITGERGGWSKRWSEPRLEIACCGADDSIVAPIRNVIGTEGSRVISRYYSGCTRCELDKYGSGWGFEYALLFNGTASKFSSENFKKYMGSGDGSYDDYIYFELYGRCNLISRRVKYLCTKIYSEASLGVSYECRESFAREKDFVARCIADGSKISQEKCKEWLKYNPILCKNEEENINSACSNRERNEAIENLSTKYSEQTCEQCKKEILKACEAIRDSGLPRKAKEFTPENVGEKDKEADEIKENEKKIFDEIDLYKKFECIDVCVEKKGEHCDTTKK